MRPVGRPCSDVVVGKWADLCVVAVGKKALEIHVVNVRLT